MHRSTVVLRNDALRVLAKHAALTPAEASSLCVDSYQRTKALKHPHLVLCDDPTASARFALAYLPPPIVRRLDRYLARRERLHDAKLPGHLPLFVEHETGVRLPRNLTPMRIREILSPTRRRAR